MKEFIKKHWLLIASLIYLIWPLDIITDLLGPFGLIDDASLLFAAFIKEMGAMYKARQEMKTDNKNEQRNNMANTSSHN